MSALRIEIDLTYAKNALFVRQSVALAFGIPIDRELTWEFLQGRICNSEDVAIPTHVLVRGLPNSGGSLGEESQMLRRLLRELESVHDIQVQFVIHD